MQETETTNPAELLNVFSVPTAGRILAIDPGTKRFGVAVSDEIQMTTRALLTIERTAWKKVLVRVKELLAEFDAVALVIGLPYNFDGTESEMSAEARRLARNFSLSLDVPVVLQDERATSYEAKKRLWSEGATAEQTRKGVDGEAAAVILGDFIARRNELSARNIRDKNLTF